MSHTYDLAENKGKKYIIKIYGKDYYGIRENEKNYNLICRLFDDDLPIASNLTNMSSMCMQAYYLTNINISPYKKDKFKYVKNLYNIFQSCINLRTVNGLDKIQNLNNNGPVMFNTCRNMVESDFRIAPYMKTIAGIYKDCYNLSGDVFTFLPDKFISTSVSCGNAFLNCKSLSFGTHKRATYTENGEKILDDKGKEVTETFLINPTYIETLSATSYLSGYLEKEIPELLSNYQEKLGKILWNNHDINWTSTTTCFKGCSDLISQYIPSGWGGTASDNIIKKDYVYIDTPDELYIPSGTTITEQALTIEINFDYADDFTSESRQRFKITDCQVFSPVHGNWIQIKDSLTIDFANTKIRLVKPTIPFNNCKYKWTFTYTDDTGNTITNYGTWHVVNI